MRSGPFRRRTPGPGLIWLALLFLGTAWLNTAAADSPRRQAFLLTVDNAIGPAIADYIIRGIETAGEKEAELVVLQLDTPGGLDSSMRSIDLTTDEFIRQVKSKSIVDLLERKYPDQYRRIKAELKP